MVRVFDYTDYRRYLQDWFAERKRENHHFSCRMLASRVGFKSSGHFTQITNGKANLSSRALPRFVEYLKLNKRETEYFELMVRYCQSTRHEEKQRCLDRMVSFKEVNPRVLNPDLYEFYSTWYYAAIRDTLAIFPLRDEFEQLGRSLKPPISGGEVRRAVKLLERLGLVRRSNDGVYERTDAVLSTRAADGNTTLIKYLVTMMEQAKRAAVEMPKSERSMSCVGFSVSEETFGRIRREIDDLRARILQMAQEDPHPSRVYHLNMQVFPLSDELPGASE